MLTDELLAYLFDGKSHLLAAPMGTWLASSRRFAAFAEAHHNKIRKKLRTAQDLESLRDLQLELETAYLLLRDRSLSLTYEPQHPRLGRAPDFAVSYTTSLEFMVEVTRMRSSLAALAVSFAVDRFVDVLCSKLGQLLTQRSNVLVIGVEPPYPVGADFHAAMLRVQQRAEASDPTLLDRHGFRDRASFFQHYQRLSALLVRGTPLQAGEPVVLWDNPQSKYPLPAKARTALSRSHMLGGTNGAK